MQSGIIDATKDDQTPLMQQYFRIKQEHPESLLLFQVGDFYELFFEDAKQAAACLGIALTARGKNKGEPIALCGVPVHALDHYLKRLIEAGFKVAICNQLEQAVPGKMVARGITQVLTPGTLTDSRLLDEKSASYLLSFFPMQESLGLLFGELLTAQIFATVLNIASAERLLETELARFYPDEIIIPNEKQAIVYQSLFKKFGYFTSIVPAIEKVEDQFDQLMHVWGQQITQQFALYKSLQVAFSYFHAYLEKNQLQALKQPWQVQLYQPEDFLQLDAATQRNLELIVSTGGTRANSLLSVLDCAITPMGSRLIKKWLVRPLIKKQAIEQRQDAVAYLVAHISFSQELLQLLKNIGDLERVVGRIALRRAQLHDYLLLAHVLSLMPAITCLLMMAENIALFSLIVSYLQGFEQLCALLAGAFNRDITIDQIIAVGFDNTLDHLRSLIEMGNQQLLALEQEEQRKTGISSLKIGYSQLHGYYFEVSKANLHLVPSDYIRYQTLVGKERYINSTLQHLQQQQIAARAQIKQAEEQLFDQVRQEVSSHLNRLRKLSYALAHLDALLSFSQVAYQAGYVRPTFNNDGVLNIKEGRHPIVEKVCLGSFIPNDTLMNDQSSFFIVTGPNMGGKSTYLRQIALVSLMAQCGSFVPATQAHLSILDRIFTRIGAGDNLAQGKSTFLVEMEETATICTQATKNSLVILDEVGRGTSTFDGLSIAQAVVEYLYEKVGAKTVFATHYHELTRLSEHYAGIINCYAASKKTEQGILFLYKIITGVADGSFGIEVARLAHLPASIIVRAQQLAHLFTQNNQINEVSKKDQFFLSERSTLCCIDNQQQASHLAEKLKQLQEFKKRLTEIDCDQISPRQASDLLWKLQQEIREI